MPARLGGFKINGSSICFPKTLDFNVGVLLYQLLLNTDNHALEFISFFVAFALLHGIL
ncbi:hypothetical protein L914_21599 [Phytophthora nicotianae]|uniref:Uncharacterized protein n=1 Tax=Phytophthora nicotianae TaxID=4792 RepID=W2M2W9_PHYNI|nr:hypothetical protein L914_21599 [Phytophthora nicotianae]